jgi:hypothetical protein
MSGWPEQGHARVERLALDLAFAANAVAELGEAAPVRACDVRLAAAELQREVDVFAREVGDDGHRVLRFARLVLEGLERELDPIRDPSA